jgi:hypothetical protein
VLTWINESTGEDAGSMTLIQMTSEEAGKLANFVLFCLKEEKNKEIRKKE